MADGLDAFDEVSGHRVRGARAQSPMCASTKIELTIESISNR
ncbi:hypothetical protein D7316_03453 [Gordonia insulae]|uniref:Uncharacterized protein n=1 Tax=Gordonia insulae TaxID=2420509 RepID=A0A3G8JPG1_9ACTN|nr:hypothetical protein D7316_03453 [Gordonia insulae]